MKQPDQSAALHAILSPVCDGDSQAIKAQWVAIGDLGIHHGWRKSEWWDDTWLKAEQKCEALTENKWSKEERELERLVNKENKNGSEETKQ